MIHSIKMKTKNGFIVFFLFIALTNIYAQDAYRNFFNKLPEKVKRLWGKWTMVQKLILFEQFLFGVSAVGAIGFITLVSSSPGMVPVIDVPIMDEDLRNRITTRINQKGYKTSVKPNGVVMVEDATIARKMPVILIVDRNRLIW